MTSEEKKINSTCKKCKGECKQFECVVLVRCPLFRETEENRKNRLFKKKAKNGSKA